VQVGLVHKTKVSGRCQWQGQGTLFRFDEAQTQEIAREMRRSTAKLYRTLCTALDAKVIFR